MGPPRYTELLALRLERLPAHERKIRLGMKAYFEEAGQGTRRELVWRLRYLAQFMGIRRFRWPQAADRLFAFDYGQAQSTLERYRTWLDRRSFSRSTIERLKSGGFRPLSRSLKAKGLLRWEFQHNRTLATEGRWALNPSGFRNEVEEWLRLQKARFASAGTLKVHLCELHHLGVYLQSRGLDYVRLGYAEALEWLEQLRAEGLSPQAFNRRLRMAKRFFAWLRARKVVEGSPFESFLAARTPRVLPRLLTEKEVFRMIRAADAGRNRAILEVMYSSGARIGDLCAMNLEKLSLEERVARTHGKGGHETILYLNDSSIRALRAYLPLRAKALDNGGKRIQPALFLCRGGNRLTRGSARVAIQAAGRKAGIKKRVHPHLLRHSFATHLLNRGADLFSIMQFMGHKNIQSTVRYLQVATERLSEVHRRFHPRR